MRLPLASIKGNSCWRVEWKYIPECQAQASILAQTVGSRRPVDKISGSGSSSLGIPSLQCYGNTATASTRQPAITMTGSASADVEVTSLWQGHHRRPGGQGLVSCTILFSGGGGGGLTRVTKVFTLKVCHQKGRARHFVALSLNGLISPCAALIRRCTGLGSSLGQG